MIRPKRDQVALTAVLAGLAFPVFALNFRLDHGVEGRASGTVTLGTMIRTDEPSPDVYPYIASQVVGLPAGKGLGNTGPADTNFKKNKPVSTVLKAIASLDIHGEAGGVFLRGYGWKDFELASGKRPYGNYPNAYQADAALSDHGFAPEARFGNLLLRDAYVYRSQRLAADTQLDWRLGRQVLDWGKSLLVGGGINAAVSTPDLAASLRPGALPEEGRLPTALLFASLTAGKTLGAEGFVKLEQRTPIFPGCGTYFDVASLIPTGCSLVNAFANTSPFPAAAGSPLTTVASLSEHATLRSGYYLRRNPDVKLRAGGQWGLSLRYTLEALDTELRAYAINTHSTLPGFRFFTPTAQLSSATPIDVAALPISARAAAAVFNYALNSTASPNGVRYAIGYAQNVHLAGLSFDTRPSPLSRIYGELALRTNAQLNWNGNDLMAAALQPAVANTALNLAKGLNLLPLGTSYDAYDRLKVVTSNIGNVQVLPSTLGAQRVVLTVEVGLSHVSGLPDPHLMRYGRAFSYGAAPFVQQNGMLSACSEAIQASGIPAGYPGKTCTTAGYVSTNAWGYRLNASASYPDVLSGASLSPSLYVAKDVRGYAYDGTYSQGRLTVRPGLRAEWGKDYYAEIYFNRFSGGDYNLLVDRSNLTVAGGVKF